MRYNNGSKDRCYNLVIEYHKEENSMSVFKLISKWNNSSETFRAQQYILNLAKEEDLVKIEEAIKQRREELAKKAPQK